MTYRMLRHLIEHMPKDKQDHAVNVQVDMGFACCCGECSGISDSEEHELSVHEGILYI